MSNERPSEGKIHVEYPISGRLVFGTLGLLLTEGACEFVSREPSLQGTLLVVLAGGIAGYLWDRYHSYRSRAEFLDRENTPPAESNTNPPPNT